jgi:hypothetical protein
MACECVADDPHVTTIMISVPVFIETQHTYVNCRSGEIRGFLRCGVMSYSFGCEFSKFIQLCLNRGGEFIASLEHTMIHTVSV